MIKAKLDLSIDIIKSRIRQYKDSTNPFYEASYDVIKNKDLWNDFNRNWVDKIALIYSWIPRIAGKDFRLQINKGDSLETCIQKNCEKKVLDLNFSLTRNLCLVQDLGEDTWESLHIAYDFLSKVSGQIGAAKILHFSFPSLCLMWDNAQISWLYTKKSRMAVSGHNYIEYHKWAKVVLNEAKNRNLIIREYAHEFPRILDKCVWYEAKNRPNECTNI